MKIQRDTESATLEAIKGVINTDNPDMKPWQMVDEIWKIIEQFDAQDESGSDERQPAKADNMSDGPSPAARPEDGKEGEGEAKKYKVSVEWLVSAIVAVDAESIEQAIEDVGARPDLPDEGSYVDGSWRVIEEFTYDENEAAPEPEEDEDEDDDPVLMHIDGAGEIRLIAISYDAGGGGAVIDTDEGEFVVFPDTETAGKAARQYWQDMAENDPSEFTLMVGQETLVQWALGQSAGPGSTHVNSLEEWLDLWLDTAEEHFASYDSAEREVHGVTTEAEEEIGFSPGVAYRCN